jgi:NAD(P)-dependent dehydrogenase (short-subunit alcohol dehydrogenase family)
MATVSEQLKLDGRRALVTGATGHLGMVICETLAELGADIVLVDRPGANFPALESTLRSNWNVDILSISCDLEIEHDRMIMIEHIRSTGAGLDILVNNAAFVGTSGLAGWATPFRDQSLETWRRAIEVNLTAVFHLCQAFVPLLASSNNGSIINIGSIYGEHGPDWRLYEGTPMGNPAAYGVSKGGLAQLTRWLATTVAPAVRVNAIAPGGIARNQPESFVQQYVARTPLGRMATEEDFRGAVAYLASALSSYVTGQVLHVDGGWGVW